MARLTCEQCPASAVRDLVGPKRPGEIRGVWLQCGQSRTWVDLDFTYQRNVAGWRPWFRCGGCRQRRTRLYWRNDKLACRVCHNLAHASQFMTPMDRLIGRAQAIRQRLGGTANLTAPFPDRPKYMHRSTYSRWRDKAAAAEQAGVAIMRDWLDRRRAARAI